MIQSTVKVSSKSLCGFEKNVYTFMRKKRHAKVHRKTAYK